MQIIPDPATRPEFGKATPAFAPAILDVTPLQIITLWEELLQCVYGDNKFGGTVAEIYLFRFMPHSPCAVAPISEVGLEAYRAANRALYSLCRLFEERNHVELELLDAGPLERLLDDEPFTHRVHISVKPAPGYISHR